MTLDGPRPDLLIEYGMQESRFGYSGRTEENVRDSDGTIRFARTFSSTGEKCTLRAINWYNRPHLNVDIKLPKDIERVLNWIKENKITILNIAGNSEQTASGIGEFVYDFLIQVFNKNE